MAEAAAAPDAISLAADDLVLPFQLHHPRPPGPRIGGKLVRLGPLVDGAIRRHAYPAPVAALVAELLALAGGLGATLKFDGVFSLQVQSEGPVRLIVADVTHAGGMRAYARFDAAAVAAAAAKDGGAPVPTLLGKGYLAFTVDQGPKTERYQGIVALEGDTLTACAQHYFRQSQQLDTALILAAGRRAGREGGAWRAAALILQRLPVAPHASEDALDPWRAAMLLMATCGEDELLDPALTPEELLFRLFHEMGVRVTPARSLAFACRCSRKRAEEVLRRLPPEELAGFKVEGRITVTCEFCNTTHLFEEAEVDAFNSR